MGLFVALQDLFNSLAHKLPAATELSLDRGRWVLSVLLFFGLAFVLFCFVSAPIRTLDCVMVRAPLLTPQGGTLLHALANSFISTNTV